MSKTARQTNRSTMAISPGYMVLLLTGMGLSLVATQWILSAILSIPG